MESTFSLYLQTDVYAYICWRQECIAVLIIALSEVDLEDAFHMFALVFCRLLKHWGPKD